MHGRFLGLLGALFIGLLGLALTPASGEPPAKKRLLVITESKGFVHECVNRKDKPLCLVEEALIDIGKKSGDFEVVCSQDSRKEITAENLKNFDAVFFYTTGDLPLSDTQKADLIAFIRSGKGFAGSHSATDTFYGWPEYGKIIGGYFDGHPWHQKVKDIVQDTKHPATRHLGESFEIEDEIYQFKAPYDRKDLHILMHLEPSWVEQARDQELKKIEEDKQKLPERLAKLEAEGKLEEAKKVKKEVENRQPAIHRTDNDCAISWTREYGKGRVFYTALGHRNELWKDERFQKHILGGLRYVLGLENADATPGK
jgi:type 1 glutamine amidotransferase